MDPSYVNAFANLSAVGILGYWLIFGLPKMLKDHTSAMLSIVKLVMQGHEQDREGFKSRAELLQAAIDRLAASQRDVCRHPGLAKPIDGSAA